MVPGSRSSPTRLPFLRLPLDRLLLLTQSLVLRSVMAAANSLDAKATAWLASNLTQEDVKLFTPLFASQGVSSVADFLNLTKEDLVELKVAIGPRNRYLCPRARSLPRSSRTDSLDLPDSICQACSKPSRKRKPQKQATQAKHPLPLRSTSFQWHLWRPSSHRSPKDRPKRGTAKRARTRYTLCGPVLCPALTCGACGGGGVRTDRV